MKFRLTSAILASALVLVSCKDGTPDTSPAQSINLLAESQQWEFGTRAYAHTEKILSFGPRPVESAALASTRAYIIAELKKSGWTCVQQPFEMDTPKGKKTFTNVIARYAPNENPRVWSKPMKGVFAAHIDSKDIPNFLGADDAASCAGALLEIAEYLHKNHPEQAGKLELVFFDGEEALGDDIIYGRRNAPQDGLYGSHHYSARVARAAASKTAPYPTLPEFGILLDMVGHENLNIKIPADTPKKLRKSYDNARAELKAEDQFGHSKDEFLDDHVPMNLAGIPTIDIIGDFNENKWWHTADDNLSIISRNSLAISIRMALRIASDHL